MYVMNAVEDLRAPFDFTSQLVRLYPPEPHDARIFTLERDPSLVIRSEGKIPSLDIADDWIGEQPELLDELADNYQIPNSGFEPTVAYHQGGDTLFIVTARIEEPNLQDALLVRDPQAIEGAEFLHTSLLSYLRDKIYSGKAYLDDIFGAYQYLLASASKSESPKPILVDVGLGRQPDRESIGEHWYGLGSLRVRQLFQDIGKLSLVSGKKYEAQAEAVDLAYFISGQYVPATREAEAMSLAYREQRLITPEEIEELTE